MATNNVLNLPELLEVILLHLPARDLLFAQKVCKTWKLTVDTTLSIQKALFFAPGTVKDIAYISPTHIPMPKWLATPESARRELSYSDRLAAQECQSFISFAEREGYALNPLLTGCNGLNVVDFRDNPWYRDADPAGSWSRMFVTQPPGSTSAQTDMKTSDGIRLIPGIVLHITQCGDRFGELVKQHRRFVGKVQREKGIWQYQVVNGRPKLINPRVSEPSEDEDEDEDEDEGEDEDGDLGE
ncbi:hypothetical protein LTR97_000607 [Elasticomyces elasticus]|uniref:F-box domain-containing protein n=1 Tax=Elasticomyces elasticus TaxID=574655 RepID=A0AAN7VXL3_9PEZI|nr:hypothetical protein LTR97_000607 [Elasticomyces elasticus]